MGPNFESAANIDDWPPNENGKPTQAVVFGVYHSTRGKVFEILWTGKFPDLQPAMYWAAKKEVEAVRKGKWIMASRLLWQHDLTPEQAVAAARVKLDPQIDSTIRQMEAGAAPDDLDIGSGPMQPVDHSKAEGYYAEIAPAGDGEGDDDADPIASFFGAPPSDDVSMNWGVPGPADDDDNDVPMNWTPPDPRG